MTVKNPPKLYAFTHKNGRREGKWELCFNLSELASVDGIPVNHLRMEEIYLAGIAALKQKAIDIEASYVADALQRKRAAEAPALVAAE